MTNSLIRVLKRRGDDFHVFHEDAAPSYHGNIQSDKIGSLALFQQKWRFISVPASRPRDDLSKAHSTGKVFASIAIDTTFPDTPGHSSPPVSLSRDIAADIDQRSDSVSRTNARSEDVRIAERVSLASQ